MAPLLADEVATATGREVTPHDFYNHPTPARLAVAWAEARRPAAAAVGARAGNAGSGRCFGHHRHGRALPRLAGPRCLLAGDRRGPQHRGSLALRAVDGGAEHHVGGMLPDHDAFDAGFFHISPREARMMDPQQRVFLEECWHALDDAGLVAAGLEGREIGVFAGAQASDYPRQGDTSHGTIGRSLAVLAARVANALDLRGPALTVDTAC